MPEQQHDIIVIGGGHAGVEAAWAASNLGADVALVTLDPSKIGVMSCNPAIGGVAKGQMVREIDALGGLMGRAADATGIMFKMLNTSKGSAVHSPRCQSDNRAYPRFIREAINSRAGMTTSSSSNSVTSIAASVSPSRDGSLSPEAWLTTGSRSVPARSCSRLAPSCAV